MEQSLERAPLAEPRKALVPRPRHQWLRVAAVVAIVGGVIWWVVQTRRTAAPVRQAGAPTAQAIPVAIQTVASTSSPRTLEVTGTVQPELEAPIASKVVARVQSVLVKEGDRVRRGQLLVNLDARDLDASIAQANANLRASSVTYENARVTARMETSLSASRIAEAQSKVAQSEAALQAATAKLALVEAGPRRQERQQALLAVSQAQSGLTLAESNLKRMAVLYREGAISAQQYDQYKSQFEVARTQFETAQQGKSIADEGSRAEEIRAAQEAVRQARAAELEANAGLKSAQASAMQADVRKEEIKGAEAQIGQSRASLQMARITRDYAEITSPFNGIISKRLADPGAMASPGMPLLTVLGGAIRLEAVVPESALISVRKGAAVAVRFDALRSRTLTGRVAEISPHGDAGSHTFIVKIDLPAGSGVSPGMFGRALFSTGVERRLLIPKTAVSEREGLHYVYAVDEGQAARLRMVTVGDPVGGQVPVLSGLNAGERIVTGSKQPITDGSAVIEGSR